jgi:hypothetical protein
MLLRELLAHELERTLTAGVSAKDFVKPDEFAIDDDRLDFLQLA